MGRWITNPERQHTAIASALRGVVCPRAAIILLRCFAETCTSHASLRSCPGRESPAERVSIDGMRPLRCGSGAPSAAAGRTGAQSRACAAGAAPSSSAAQRGRSPSGSSGWSDTAADGEDGKVDRLRNLGQAQNYNINVDHGARGVSNTRRQARGKTRRRTAHNALLSRHTIGRSGRT